MGLRKDWADWWARLASIADIESSTRGDIKGLFADYLNLLDDDSTSRPIPEGAVRSDGGRMSDGMRALLNAMPDGDDAERTFISRAHAIALDVIAGLVDRTHAFVPSLPESPPTRPTERFAWRLDESNILRVQCVGVEPLPLHIERLWGTFEAGKPFLYARCPVCRRVFARSGRQIRCSTKCTRQAIDEARQGTPERREQVRAAVKAHRERSAGKRRRERGING